MERETTPAGAQLLEIEADEEAGKVSFLAAAIAVFRLRSGLAKGDFIRHARLKKATWRQIEKGKREPSPLQLARLSAAVGQCPERLIELARLLETIEGLPPATSLAPASEALDLRVGFDQRLLAATHELVPATSQESIRELGAERQIAACLVACLGHLEAKDRVHSVERSRAFRGGLVVERLGDESTASAGNKAPEAKGWADLAYLAARLTRLPEPQRRRLLALARGFQGNAARVASDLLGAERLFAEGLALFSRSAPLPGLDDSRFFDLLASLRRDQRRLKEALDLLDRALENATQGNRGRLFIKRAQTLETLGRNEEAIADLRRASAAIDPAAEPRLDWIVRFNLLVNLCDLDRTAEAEPLLLGVQEQCAQFGNDLDALRLDWLTGRIAAGQGRLEEAIERLDRVRRAFLDRGIAFDAALATLELAVFLLEAGRTAEVKAATRPLAPLFGALRIDREALAALQLFCTAAEREAVTLLEARRLRKLLRKGQCKE
jgi:tetratricopeptide (TPR) repeat protein